MSVAVGSYPERMAGVSTELTETLDGATPGNRSDGYSQLATWTSVLERATGRNGRDGFREVTDPTPANGIDFVDGSTTAPTAGPSESGEPTSAIDWALLRECVDAYPPGVGDNYWATILASVVARRITRTRVRSGVDDSPAWALEYLSGITMADDGEWAFESSLAVGRGVGRGVGHSAVSVLDRTIARVEAGDESVTFGVLDHATCADPDAGVELFERHSGRPRPTRTSWFSGAWSRPGREPFSTPRSSGNSSAPQFRTHRWFEERSSGPRQRIR